MTRSPTNRRAGRTPAVAHDRLHPVQCNCGVEVRLDAAGHQRVRGDNAHPPRRATRARRRCASTTTRTNNDRLLAPAPARRRHLRGGRLGDRDPRGGRRLAGGTRRHGGDTILYYGGGGQGNHLGGAYGAALHRGSAADTAERVARRRRRVWVNGNLFGNAVRGEFETARSPSSRQEPVEQPRHPDARTTLKEIADDPARAMVVIDPRRTETADLADSTSRSTPGRDACCGGDGRRCSSRRASAEAWLPITPAAPMRVAAFARARVAGTAVAGVAEDLVRRATRRIAAAQRRRVRGPRRPDQPPLDTGELPGEAHLDPHGNFGNPGGHTIPRRGAARQGVLGRLDGARAPRSPVTGARISAGSCRAT